MAVLSTQIGLADQHGQTLRQASLGLFGLFLFWSFRMHWIGGYLCLLLFFLSLLTLFLLSGQDNTIGELAVFLWIGISFLLLLHLLN
jgi:hypothetical protein